MATTVANNRWVREPEDFAVRLGEKDLSGLFSRRIVIEDGTTGLLIIQGRFDRTLGPGEHVLEGGVLSILKGKDKKHIVLVNLGDVMLHVTLPRLLTRDPVPFGMQTAITLRFTPGREAIFLSNLMSGKESVQVSDLRNLVYAEMNEAAQEWAGGHTIRELADDLSLRDELAMILESSMRGLLDRYGLTFGRLEIREFKCEILDKTTNMRVETSLQVSEEQARLEGRKRFFDIAVESDIQDIAEETQKVATYEKRIALWQRMQLAANQEQMNKMQSEQDLEEFMRGVDHDKLLKEDEFDRFKTELREQADDRERLEAHFVRVAQMEEEYEYRRKELTQQTGLSREQLEGEMGLERLRVESRLETDLKRTDLELERQRREAERRREEEDLEAAARWERELGDAKTAAGAQNLARETARLDAEMALAAEGKRVAQERHDRQEQSRMELDRQANEQEMALKAQEAEVDLRLRELRERHRQELESMQAMDALSLHTLIAVSEGEKAPLLAELARAEVLKDLSPDKILAIAAEKSPELGSAVAEIANKGDSEQAKAMYERLLAEQKEASSEMRESQREMTDTMKEMFNKALETQSEVSKAFAYGGGQRPQVPETPASSSPAPEAPIQRVVVCRRCSQESAVGTKFCPNCGGGLLADPQ